MNFSQKNGKPGLLSYKQAKGFTLVELMIVVGIIGILAAISIPSYQSYMERGRGSTAKGDLMNLASNMEVYKQGNFSYTGATAADLYSAGSPPDAATPHYNLNVQITNGGRGYLLSAVANPASNEASDDGTYWLNPTGRNCYFPNGGGYSATCAGGEEW